MTIVPWSERSIEQARLLNPAFLAVLIWSCADGYNSVSQGGIPYPLLFVGMPIILHKPTRAILPSSIRTSMAVWLGRNTHVHIRFTERAVSLVPLVKEGVLFGVNGQLLSFASSQVVITSRPRSIHRFLRESSEEVQDCIRKAKFVGRWLASSGNYTTVMALWGVMP